MNRWHTVWTTAWAPHSLPQPLGQPLIAPSPVGRLPHNRKHAPYLQWSPPQQPVWTPPPPHITQASLLGVSSKALLPRCRVSALKQPRRPVAKEGRSRLRGWPSFSPGASVTSGAATIFRFFVPRGAYSTACWLGSWRGKSVPAEPRLGWSPAWGPPQHGLLSRQSHVEA